MHTLNSSELRKKNVNNKVLFSYLYANSNFCCHHTTGSQI